MSAVKVIDGMPGAGKSSWAIQHMNENKDKIFMYVTPFNSEVDRIVDSSNGRIHTPKRNGMKSIDLEKMIAKGRSVAITHTLFKMINCDMSDLIKSFGYTLIIDEALSTFEILEEYNETDFTTLTEKARFLSIGEDSKAVWNHTVDSKGREHDGVYSEIKAMASTGSLMALKKYEKLVWCMPKQVIESFENAYIMTYMFMEQDNRYYFDMAGINYEIVTVTGNREEGYKLDDFENRIDKRMIPKIKQLITIIDDEKLNAIGDSTYSLSKRWYAVNTNKKEDVGVVGIRGKANGCGLRISTMKKGLEKFFREHCKGDNTKFLWTTFKDNKESLKGAKYTKCFLSCTARATNEYSDRTHVAYMINRFQNTVKSSFFAENGCKVDNDTFALSEFLQFIFRSAIRNGEPITLYVPSKRMRTLLVNYLNCTSQDSI